MTGLRTMTLQQKLGWMVILALVASLFLTLTMIVSYEITTYRPKALARAGDQAEVLRDIVLPAVEFADTATTTQLLATMSHQQDVRAAAVFTADDRLLAEYWRAGTGKEAWPPSRRGAITAVAGGGITVVRPIISNGATIGWVCLLTDLAPLASRWSQYGASFAISTVSLVILAGLLSLMLRKTITEPIRALAATAHEISNLKDYTLRAEAGSGDEVGYLARSFNSMLASINERDARLAQHYRGLVELTRIENDFRLDYRKLLEAVTEISARAHSLERVSIWLFDAGRTLIRCEDLYEMSVGRHSSGQVLHQRDYPAYFAALASEVAIDATDVRLDPRTCEFTKRYLDPSRVGAMLDVPIYWRSRVVGVICHEHVGDTKVWNADEVGFAVSVADRIALILESVEAAKVEAEHRESEERYRSLIEEARDAIFTLSPDGTILHLNQAVKTITGWRPSLWVGRKFVEALQGDEAVLAQQRFMDVAGGGQPQSFELHIRSRSGSVVTMEIVVSARKKGGEVIGVMGVGRDVTERRQADEAKARLEDQLRHAQKTEAIGTLAGGIAHDFNNILTGIIGYTQMAAMDLPANHPVQEWLKPVLEASGRARNLVNQILAFSRRQEQQRVPLLLHEVVEEVLKLLRPSLPATIEIRTELLRTCPTVMADANQLHQVLMNLATNAAHAMGPSGGLFAIRQDLVEVDELEVLRLPQLRQGRFVRLTVSDSGCGMPPAVLARIFEPFFTTKPLGEGTGLGLAVVLGIIQQHDGAVIVRSTVGQGTDIQLYLPVSAASPPVAVSSSPKPTPQGEGKHVMVVDDEESIGKLAEKVLQRLGYRASVFTDPVAALRAFQASPASFHLVMTDLTMPGLKGTALAEELRRVRPALPIVLCTGFGDAMDRADMARFKRLFALPKPFSVEALTAAVTEALQSPIEES
jgi:PAS domain S-box-containing protein